MSLLCSSGWPHPHHPPASASLLPGSQVCIPKVSCGWPFLIGNITHGFICILYAPVHPFPLQAGLVWFFVAMIKCYDQNVPWGGKSITQKSQDRSPRQAPGGGNWSRDLEMLLTGLLFSGPRLTSFLVQPRPPCLGMVPPPAGWALPHLLAIKKNALQMCPESFCLRQCFSWGSLFPSVKVTTRNSHHTD